MILSFPQDTAQIPTRASLVIEGVSGLEHANVEALLMRWRQNLGDTFSSCGLGLPQMDMDSDCWRIQSPVCCYKCFRERNMKAAGESRVVIQPQILDL